jgi:phospholipid-binding lipoprotein MlaA
VKGIGVEPARFLINTTIGVCGFFDPAKAFCNMKAQEVDFDQTLGRYGMEPMMYINWPILGPSSVRGTLGLIGDTGFDPSTYLISPLIKVGISSYEGVNETSLTIGEYEDLKESALDPYIAVRDAYFQNRESKLKEQ